MKARFLLCLALLMTVLLPEITASAYAAQSSRKTVIYPDTLKLPFHRLALRPYMRPARKSVGLALSGGGANGLAQIGILKALEEEGITVDYIAGTSMGAVIGGLYSCGYSAAELEKIASGLPWQSIVSLRNDYSRSNIFLEQQRIRDRATFAIRFDKLKLLFPKSLGSAQVLTGTLDLLTLNGIYRNTGSFSNLPVNFRAVTTDLVSGKRITLTNGSLSEAMLASSTIPVLFEPVKRDSYDLVDGGLVANLPVDELNNANVQYKIAVDTHGSMYSSSGELDIPWKAADQTMTILTKLQYPSQLEKADIVITPDLNEHKATDFSDVKSLVNSGYSKGKLLAGTIKRSIEPGNQQNIPIRGYTKKIEFPDKNPEYQEHYRIVSGIIRNSDNAGKILEELLATDLFTSAHVELDKQQKTAVFHLEPLKRISKISVTGGPFGEISTEEIESCFLPVKEKLYTNTSGTRSLESLVRKYRDKGLSLVNIENVSIKNGVLDIRLSSGKPDAIEIVRDRNKTALVPVRREVKIDTTRVLRLKKAEESIDNLYETGVFNRVSLSQEPQGKNDRGANNTLKFTLNEKPESVLRAGFRYDETYNAQLLLDFRNENLAGTTNSVGGWVKAGRKSSLLNLEYNAPRIGSTHFTMSSRLFFDQHVFETRDLLFSKQFFPTEPENSGSYGIQRYGFTTSFGTRIRKNGQFVIDMTLQNAQSYIDRKDLNPLKTAEYNLFSFGTQFTLDSRNNTELPTSGSYTNLRYAITPTVFNDNDIFWQVTGNHEENIRLGNTTTLQFSGLLGLSSSYMPLSEKYFLGGPGTPYSRRFVGLKESELQGNNVAAAGLGLYYKPEFSLVFPTSFLLQYNAGNVWEQRKDIGFRHLIHGVGTSMIWETPLGPARFTVSKAFAFLEQPDDTGSSSIHFSDTMFYFSIGHDF